jgi:hypothetical protein
LPSSPDSNGYIDAAPQEVVLHGIRLPQGVSSEGGRSENQNDHLFFVGIEVVKPDATLPDELNASVQAAVKDLMMSAMHGGGPGDPAGTTTDLHDAAPDTYDEHIVATCSLNFPVEVRNSCWLRNIVGETCSEFAAATFPRDVVCAHPQYCVPGYGRQTNSAQTVFVD